MRRPSRGPHMALASPLHGLILYVSHNMHACAHRVKYTYIHVTIDTCFMFHYGPVPTHKNIPCNVHIQIKKRSCGEPLQLTQLALTFLLLSWDGLTSQRYFSHSFKVAYNKPVNNRQSKDTEKRSTWSTGSLPHLQTKLYRGFSLLSQPYAVVGAQILWSNWRLKNIRALMSRTVITAQRTGSEA